VYCQGGIKAVNNQKQQFLSALDDLSQTVQILTGALTTGDSDKSHEAVTILLQQGLMYFGAESEVMKQFFPVFDRIKRHIDANNLSSALGQTRVFEQQLGEVITIVASN
jgi:hypothetical protein